MLYQGPKRGAIDLPFNIRRKNLIKSDVTKYFQIPQVNNVIDTFC